MEQQSTNTKPQAMAIFHSDGLVPAYKLAKTFMGEGGRLATLPDIMDARSFQLQNRLSLDQSLSRWGAVWDTYYTTASAEYMGEAPDDGRLVIIVAHGIGPMATIDGMKAAYKHQYRDKTGDIRGGRITKEEFAKLYRGEYGAVEIVDLKECVEYYEENDRYAFISACNRWQLRRDKLFKARLGERWESYAMAQEAVYLKWLEANQDDEESRLRKGGSDLPFSCANLFAVADNGNFGYKAMLRYPEYWQKVSEGGTYAVAHLIVVGQAHVVKYCWNDSPLTGVVTEIGLHGWNNGTRLVGIRSGTGPLREVHPGPQYVGATITKNWQRFSTETDVDERLRHLNAFYRLDDSLDFTVRQSSDKVLQSSLPEFRVTQFVRLGEARFTTNIEGYYGFFRYSPLDVRKLAPPGANAFRFTDEPKIICEDGNPSQHTIGVEFYWAEVQLDRRLMTEDDILGDAELAIQVALSQET